MKKGYIILAVLITVGIALIVLGILLSGNKGPKQIELKFETNGGVPYEWQYGIEDETIAKFVKSYEVENKNDGTMVGAPIVLAFVFEGVNEGTTTIRFKYVNITDGSLDKEEEYLVKVDKDKNISLVTK